MPASWITSFIETAKTNGLEPYTYFCIILKQRPSANRVEKMGALLPWNTTAEQDPRLT